VISQQNLKIFNPLTEEGDGRYCTVDKHSKKIKVCKPTVEKLTRKENIKRRRQSKNPDLTKVP
jgi:hypothetical protein